MAALMRIFKISQFRPVFRPLASTFVKTEGRYDKSKSECFRNIHRNSRLSSVPAVKHENVNYPPVTPRWPPGVWGEVDEKRAWELFEESAALEDTTVLWDKLNKLTEKEHYFFAIHPFKINSPPRLLPYQQFLTKTHLIRNELPKNYGQVNVDPFMKILVPLIAEAVEYEKARIYAKFDELKENPTLDITQDLIDKELSESVMKILLQIIVTHLSSSCEHLVTSQQDEYPTHEAFWSVAGMREECEHLTDDGLMNLQYSHQPLYSLRGDLPLPEFVDINDEVCQHPDLVTESHFIPKVYEIDGAQHNGRINTGFLTKTPFNDPCPAEFGHLTVNCIPSLNYLREEYSPQEVSDLATGCGMMSAFGSTLTQAHSQGFNWLCDLTYPITTQTVVFDGQNISFYAYQLNNLSLWKIGERGIPYNNVCWALPEMPLFVEKDENNTHGLNEEALKNLIKFVALKPMDRGINMRPYLSETVEDLLHQSYINKVDEPLVDRPHPPRLFAKSKKVKVISPIVVTAEKIDKLYQRAEEHWDAEKKRFVPGPRQRRPNNRIRESD